MTLEKIMQRVAAHNRLMVYDQQPTFLYSIGKRSMDRYVCRTTRLPRENLVIHSISLGSPVGLRRSEVPW